MKDLHENELKRNTIQKLGYSDSKRLQSFWNIRIQRLCNKNREL